jgi:hypothetical protein
MKGWRKFAVPALAAVGLVQPAAAREPVRPDLVTDRPCWSCGTGFARRAACAGWRQGLDISAIPLGIVERMEVVPDGASEIYGFDAVAGVVNVILRRDFDGVEARADLGGATDGAGWRQQYGLVAGNIWSSGALVAAYEYQDIEGILSSQRSVSANRPGLMLLPDQRQI